MMVALCKVALPSGPGHPQGDNQLMCAQCTCQAKHSQRTAQRSQAGEAELL
jgi:hypothetical protein